MRSLCFLFVVVSAAYAAQVASPVYRAQPTIVTAKNPNSNNNANMNANPAAQAQAQQAEERESPAFPTSDNAKAVNSVVNGGQTATLAMPATTLHTVQPAVLQPATAYVPTVVQPTSGQATYTSEPQQYQVYMKNPAVSVANPYTAYTQQAYDGQYNPLQYQQGTTPSDGLLNNIPWRDVLVGLSSLALLGLGASLAYPALKSLRSRALRELQDIKAEDATRMASNVMRAIQKFSEINRHD